ncbi:hypothetical protein NMY22_g4636 [Coprinellus aureogranulatus]|nr:hypothetical protein NMY22_g4636 [Coprinellus aureogranulatus]
MCHLHIETPHPSPRPNPLNWMNTRAGAYIHGKPAEMVLGFVSDNGGEPYLEVWSEQIPVQACIQYDNIPVEVVYVRFTNRELSSQTKVAMVKVPQGWSAGKALVVLVEHIRHNQDMYPTVSKLSCSPHSRYEIFVYVDSVQELTQVPANCPHLVSRIVGASINSLLDQGPLAVLSPGSIVRLRTPDVCTGQYVLTYGVIGTDNNPIAPRIRLYYVPCIAGRYRRLTRQLALQYASAGAQVIGHYKETFKIVQTAGGTVRFAQGTLEKGPTVQVESGLLYEAVNIKSIALANRPPPRYIEAVLNGITDPKIALPVREGMRAWLSDWNNPPLGRVCSIEAGCHAGAVGLIIGVSGLGHRPVYDVQFGAQMHTTYAIPAGLCRWKSFREFDRDQSLINRQRVLCPDRKPGIQHVKLSVLCSALRLTQSVAILGENPRKQYDNAQGN